MGTEDWWKPNTIYTLDAPPKPKTKEDPLKSGELSEKKNGSAEEEEEEEEEEEVDSSRILRGLNDPLGCWKISHFTIIQNLLLCYLNAVISRDWYQTQFSYIQQQLPMEEQILRTGSSNLYTSQQTLNICNKTRCRKRQPEGAFPY